MTRRDLTAATLVALCAAAMAYALAQIRWDAMPSADLVPYVVATVVGMVVGFHAGRHFQAFMGGRNFIRGQRKLIREGLPR